MATLSRVILSLQDNFTGKMTFVKEDSTRCRVMMRRCHVNLITDQSPGLIEGKLTASQVQ